MVEKDDYDLSIGPNDKETKKMYMLLSYIAKNSKDPDAKRIAESFHTTLGDWLEGERKRRASIRKTKSTK